MADAELTAEQRAALARAYRYLLALASKRRAEQAAQEQTGEGVGK
jgi:hypothetical protein